MVAKIRELDVNYVFPKILLGLLKFFRPSGNMCLLVYDQNNMWVKTTYIYIRLFNQGNFFHDFHNKRTTGTNLTLTLQNVPFGCTSWIKFIEKILHAYIFLSQVILIVYQNAPFTKGGLKTFLKCLLKKKKKKKIWNISVL